MTIWDSLESAEDFAVEQLVAQASVEALDVPFSQGLPHSVPRGPIRRRQLVYGGYRTRQVLIKSALREVSTCLIF
jgi:hypothetical protein